MKKTWHTVFLILLICLDAALLLLPLLPGYRALFDIGPHPGRPPAFRFLKLAGYALFFPLTAYGCGRGLCADRHGAGLPAQQRAAHALPAGQRLGTRAAYV